THRGAIALVVILLEPERVIVADLEELGDVIADALVDLLPEIDVMRVERVVEIEHPGFDLGEVAGSGAVRLGRDHDVAHVSCRPREGGVPAFAGTTAESVFI